MPGRYSYIDVGEKDEDNPMSWDQIPQATYKSWDGYLNYDEVVASSRLRIEANPFAQLIDENARWVRDQQNDTSYPLSLESYRKELESDRDFSKKMEALQDFRNGLQFGALPDEKLDFEANPDLEEKRMRWYEALQKDLYVDEAVSILESLKLRFLPTKKLAVQQQN